MQTIDTQRVATIREKVSIIGKTRTYQLVYEWTRTKTINFETFLEMVSVLEDM
jgi:hypothetical protein